MCLRYESTTIYCGRTSQEVRELKCHPEGARDIPAGRTSQEVRELKFFKFPEKNFPRYRRTSQEVRELKFPGLGECVPSGSSHLARGA